jgi:quercetin dioxygenase-like cupin family protein
MRNIDIAASLDVLNLGATYPEEFICQRQALQGDWHTISVDSQFFRIEHIEVAVGKVFQIAADDAHCLHVLRGSVEIATNDAHNEHVLKQGESAFVPFGVRSWQGRVKHGDLHLVKVHLP